MNTKNICNIFHEKQVKQILSFLKMTNRLGSKIYFKEPQKESSKASLIRHGKRIKKQKRYSIPWGERKKPKRNKDLILHHIKVAHYWRIQGYLVDYRKGINYSNNLTSMLTLRLHKMITLNVCLKANNKNNNWETQKNVTIKIHMIQ